MQNHRYKCILFLSAVLVLAACSDSPDMQDSVAESQKDSSEGILKDHQGDIGEDFFSSIPERFYPGFGVQLGEEVPGFTVLASEGRIESLNGRVYFLAPALKGVIRFSLIGQTDALLAEVEREVWLPPEAELEIQTLSPDVVEGRFGNVLFAASTDGGKTGKARFWIEDGQEISVTLDGFRQASLQWNGITIDGNGKLQVDESRALRSLSISPFARAISEAPLALRCEDGMPEPMLASLLFPWQILLKYQVANRTSVISYFIDRTRCEEEGLSYDEELQRFMLDQSLILWSSDHVIPVVQFYFPFDGEGQLMLGHDQ